MRNASIMAAQAGRVTPITLGISRGVTCKLLILNAVHRSHLVHHKTVNRTGSWRTDGPFSKCALPITRNGVAGVTRVQTRIFNDLAATPSFGEGVAGVTPPFAGAISVHTRPFVLSR